MSFKHVHNILESALPKHLKLTAIVFAEFADLDTGECYPSVPTVARRASSDRRTVQRNVHELIDRGVLTEIGVHFSGTKIYLVISPEPGCDHVALPDPRQGGGNMPPQASEGGGKVPRGGDADATGGGGTHVAEGAASMPPEPSKNHHRNHQGDPDASQSESQPSDDGEKFNYEHPNIPGLNQEAWARLVAYRKKRRYPPFETSTKAEQLAALPNHVQQQCVDYTIDNAYQGLFPDRFAGENHARNSSKLSAGEQQRERLRQKYGEDGSGMGSLV